MNEDTDIDQMSSQESYDSPNVDVNEKKRKLRPAFEFIFAQEQTHFFKHAVVLEMDASIGDIKSIIIDRQRMLMLQIEDYLLEVEPQLQHVSIIMSTLDALISLGSENK